MRNPCIADSCLGPFVCRDPDAEDIVPPILVPASVANTSSECDAVPDPIDVTARDNSMGFIPMIQYNTTKHDTSCDSAYDQVRRWDVSDSSGNMAEPLIQLVRVDDSHAPIDMYKERIINDEDELCGSMPTICIGPADDTWVVLHNAFIPSTNKTFNVHRNHDSHLLMTEISDLYPQQEEEEEEEHHRSRHRHLKKSRKTSKSQKKSKKEASLTSSKCTNYTEFISPPGVNKDPYKLQQYLLESFEVSDLRWEFYDCSNVHVKFLNCFDTDSGDDSHCKYDDDTDTLFLKAARASKEVDNVYTIVADVSDGNCGNVAIVQRHVVVPTSLGKKSTLKYGNLCDKCAISRRRGTHYDWHLPAKIMIPVEKSSKKGSKKLSTPIRDPLSRKGCWSKKNKKKKPEVMKSKLTKKMKT